MNDNAWDELVTLIEDKYPQAQVQRRTEPLEDSPHLNKTITSLLFERENTSYKIERVVSPRIIDKKTHYHHRGSADRVEYLYDPEEITNKVLFYRQTPSGEFTEITPEALLS